MILEFLGLKREKKRGFFKNMKAHFRSQTGKHYKKNKNHVSENIKIILQRP